jgi:hypothetical protein
MKTKKLKCESCVNAWRVVIDDDPVATRLHGCKVPRKQKFGRSAKLLDAPCKEYVDCCGVRGE